MIITETTIDSLPPELLRYIFTFVTNRAAICSVNSKFNTYAVLCSKMLSKYPELYEQKPILTKKLANDIILSGDHHLFIRLFGKKYLNLELACQGGSLELTRLMIDHGANNWNYSLYGACYGGSLELTRLMIDHGANNWNYGLYGACRGGNLELAQLMIDNGATDWNWGLRGACHSGSLELARLMIDHGATQCSCGKPISEHK